MNPIQFCSYNQLWVFTINGNALHHTKLIMAIFTDQLPFSTENLDGRWETNMYLFPSIQSPQGVLSHSHPMWNISTWQVAKLWPGYLLHSKASHCNQHRRGHCAWCPWDYVIMMSLFWVVLCMCKGVSISVLHATRSCWLLSHPLSGADPGFCARGVQNFAIRVSY